MQQNISGNPASRGSKRNDAREEAKNDPNSNSSKIRVKKLPAAAVENKLLERAREGGRLTA